ncbi:MAG TPA: hypothetical protein VNW46_18735 [Gemmatimonadaceae bacterium]|jgi:hypothetical protein|nr:hypothetical protein [Gemmatimonadaceae bacterium]
MTWATETHRAPEPPASSAGEAEFQEMAHHVRELSRLLKEKEAALHAVYAREDLQRPTGRGPSPVVFAFLACALIAATLIAWRANGRPVEEQSNLWVFPLTTAGVLFAAAFVSAVHRHYQK